jgi:putative thioredoxin
MVTDTQNFQEDVIERSFRKPVLVDFWAEWCGPCKVLGPALERFAEKYRDRFELIKLNTDHFPEISQQYGIKGIPNVKLFIDGMPEAEFTGALPEAMVEDWIKKNIPGKNDSLFIEAKRLVQEGKTEDALAILHSLKEAEPDNDNVKLVLAQINLFDSPSESYKMIENIEPDPDNSETLNSVKTIAELLIKKEDNNFPEGEVKEDYKKAVEYLSQKNFDKALEEFINIIRTDRSYDDDGARKACIAVFKYLGEGDSVTLKHRRDFGSALYV